MGTEAFWIPAVLAATSAAGAGVNYANQKSANSRADAAETQGIINQQNLARQANGQVAKTTQQIATDSPQAIAAKATGDYVAQLRKNAAGSTQGGSTTSNPTLYGSSVSSLPGVPGGSSRFNADTAAAQQQVQDYGNTAATQMGGLDAATRLRQNEGLDLQGLGTNLNLVGAQSGAQGFIDQLRASSAGQANPWASLGAGLLSGGAAAGASAYGYNKKPVAASPFGGAQ